MAVGGVWIPVTLLASSAQTLRNAMQRDLIGVLGAVGAAQVRFLFGLPFTLMFLAGLMALTGSAAPLLTPANFAWTVFGAASQVIATSLMLAAMRTKSFVVAVAYTKTEAAQIALFGLIALNNPPTAALTAIALATIGVALMAIRSRKELTGDWRSAALGVFSATFFAFAAIGFRSAVIGVVSPSRVLSASVILVVGLAIQSAALGLYLAAFDRAAARHRRSVALVFVRRLHGRAGVPALVRRLCAERSGASAHAGADRGADGPGRVAENVSRAAELARGVRHQPDRRRRGDTRVDCAVRRSRGSGAGRRNSLPGTRNSNSLRRHSFWPLFLSGAHQARCIEGRDQPAREFFLTHSLL
jgi:hypothetical protein